ncbi:dipeptide ABC transporter ATP-binding protein [soil metagenome]
MTETLDKITYTPAPVAARRSPTPVLEVSALTKDFDIRTRQGPRTLRAVGGVSFQIPSGSTFALVGESGCGKSTIGRAILRLVEPTSGSVRLAGVDVTRAKASQLKALRCDMQMVFQDPYSSLDPRYRVIDCIREPMRIQGLHRRGVDPTERALTLMKRVGLGVEHAFRYPHQFSGGQRQRIGLARALALNPKLIVCDEPVSALDVSIQAQVINLMRELQRDLGLAYLFISHDMSVVRLISDHVGVMYLGKLVEQGPTEDVFDQPAHPYTKALLSAVPRAGGTKAARVPLCGEVPSPMNPPSGCVFHPRCPSAIPICSQVVPEATVKSCGRLVACHCVD